MALASTTVWECRADGGDIQNSAGFNPSNATPGTDYSQQANSQYDGTDLASADATLSSPVVTSVSHSFVAADCGNILRLSAGTNDTPGYYEIVSVDGSGGAILDRACGTGVLSSGTYRVGGACPLTTTSADALFESFVAGNTCWVKSGSYSPGAFSVTNDATAYAPVLIKGYTSSRGDACTGTDRPLWAMGANASAFAGAYYHFYNIRMNTSQASGFSITTAMVYNCKSEQTSTGVAFTIPISSKMINCEATSTGTAAVSASADGASFIGNYIHDSVIGINVAANADNNLMQNNIIDNCTTAIQIGNAGTNNKIIGNTLYGAETPAGTGIIVGTSLTTSIGQVITNNIIYGFTTGINCFASTPSMFIDFNNFYNCTTPRTNTDVGPNDTALNPGFTDAANGDFSTNSNMQSIALPGAFPGGLSTGYLDCGAVQSHTTVQPTYPMALSLASFDYELELSDTNYNLEMEVGE